MIPSFFSLAIAFLITFAAHAEHVKTTNGSAQISRENLKPLLERFPKERIHIVRLVELIERLSATQNRVKERGLALVIGARLQDSGHLPEILTVVLKLAFQANLLPSAITEKNLNQYTHQLAEAIDAETCARGMTRKCQGAKYEEWAALSQRLMKDLLSKTHGILGRGKSGFRNPRFLRLFESETRARFRGQSEVRLLVDGPESFRERERMIREAKSSIHILSWAFYDDISGQRMADLLIRKLEQSKQAGNPIDIRIMVDGLTARNPPYRDILPRLEAAGIQVIRWLSQDPIRRFDGQHRKIMIIDGNECIEGGMNFGDAYSHEGPPGSPRWRDTDILVRGEGVTESNALFARLWNEQVERRKDLPSHYTRVMPRIADSVSQGAQVSLIDHTPLQGENILRANLLAIEAAETSIDIQNAYFILDPATHQALLRAKKRGVRIRILTNSVESIDVPEMAYLIMRGVNQLVADGFQVYLKKGDTLHSKVMNVDGIYSWVGSYNFHPRSFRYEGEILRAVLDENFGAHVRRVLDQDFRAAERVTRPIPIPKSPIVDLLQLWFYDQL